MREQTIYIADDGTHWDDAAEAKDRDSKLRAIADAMHGLGERPTDDPSFTGGFSYLQHDVDAVARSKAALSKLEEYGGDFGNCLTLAMRRLNTIDDLGREWASVYYAAHPSSDAIEAKAGGRSPSAEANNK